METDADVEGIYLERVREPRLNVSNGVVQANLVFNRGSAARASASAWSRPAESAATSTCPVPSGSCAARGPRAL